MRGGQGWYNREWRGLKGRGPGGGGRGVGGGVSRRGGVGYSWGMSEKDSSAAGGREERRGRGTIRVLPEALINKIAAGEVVERPASVVKELLENAIDAGATAVQIRVEEGGRTLIRIADNGSGIPPEEAALAFAQHATSKIQTVEDLFAISTMGFRGEALASIASVSHATMTTRTHDRAQGVRIEVKDSLVSGAVPCAASPGTTIEIRDLFYSVPARRKFLRTDATEFGHIHEMVLRTALPNPQVAIELSHNGRSVLDLPATEKPLIRVSEGLGREYHEHLIAVDFAERDVAIRGFIGQPSLARATAKYQYIFLNGRYIRDRSILHAVKEAYRGLIEPASQPMAVLFVEMDPEAFDVNVHPQKTEVRFRDSGGIYRVVLAALREKLLGSDLTPQVKTANRFDGPTGPGASHSPATGGQFTSSPPTAGGGYGRSQGSSGFEGGQLSRPSISETREVIAEFFKQAPAAQPRLAFGVETGARREPSPIEDPSRMTLNEGSGVRGEGTALENLPASAAAWRFVQLHNTYIVAETGDGLVIIDQHALHERIIYEELFARATRGPLEGQRLLIPEVLAVGPRQLGVLEQVKGLLMKLGIEVAAFDAQSVAVHTFPSLLSKVSPREFLRDLLDKLLEVGSKLTPEELLHEVLDMASCKAAVKAGYALSPDEIAALLERKGQVDRSSNCPHGRPTTLRLTIGDLERQFKRK